MPSASLRVGENALQLSPTLLSNKEEREKFLQGDGNVLYADGDDGSTTIYICQNPQHCRPKWMDFIIYKLYF